MVMTDIQTITASRFKAECLALLDRVASRGQVLLITKRGRPVAKVVPVRTRTAAGMRKSVTFLGDLVGPILGSWEMEK